MPISKLRKNKLDSYRLGPSPRDERGGRGRVRRRESEDMDDGEDRGNRGNGEHRGITEDRGRGSKNSKLKPSKDDEGKSS
jgi:hypothetical protein